MSELDDIQRRVGGATEGPWRSENCGSDCCVWVTSPGGRDGQLAGISNMTDAEFIAHARTDVPELLALVRTQQATLAAVLNLANTAGRTGWRISADELRRTLRGES